ncbi:hypothetical protein J1N35_037159 [Gossypium stocksii]|uniref:ABC transporter domain-containing protein n=1 Tax=Gossypium stocksii TaxID=47602 RepID=A0A9D3UJC6_9ROSI|nr:hypothetical protein J1N35_037159 [Gossypium stocksii]
MEMYGFTLNFNIYVGVMIQLFKVKEKHRQLAENANGGAATKKQSPGELRLHKGVGIIGPSGIGKSTILKIIAGLLAPNKVFQSAAIFDSLTVRENVGFLL